MDILTAHEILAAAAFESGDSLSHWLPEDCDPIWHIEVDPTIALIAAGCELTGWLPTCTSLADLREAFDHFITLLRCGVVTGDQWNTESQRVILNVLDWGNSIAFK